MFADNKFSNPIKKQLVNSAASDVITLSYLDKFFYQHSKLEVSVETFLQVIEKYYQDVHIGKS